MQALSTVMAAILCPPFEWCHIPGGGVIIQDARHYGGSQGGPYQVNDFAIAKYPITNAQYQRFLDHPHGYANPHWWEYSPEAAQWRRDHQTPRPAAFEGPDLPRTRVSWFDSMAFCHWLTAELGLHGAPSNPALEPHDLAKGRIRLPTEQEWQRAAVGDTGWQYPWGNQLDETRGNYRGQIGHPTPVTSYPGGIGPYGTLDMVGNVWEWCLTAWGMESIDVGGYTYRLIKGGAWNVANPDHLRATDRGGNSPRGRLNDAGFRCAYAANSSA